MQSAQTELIGFSLLTLSVASSWSGPDQSTRTDWMIHEMSGAFGSRIWCSHHFRASALGETAMLSRGFPAYQTLLPNS
jgi:hypothetical protein